MPTTAPVLALPAVDTDSPAQASPQQLLPPWLRAPAPNLPTAKPAPRTTRKLPLLLFPSPVQSVHEWRRQDRQEQSLGLRADVSILEESFKCHACQIGVGAGHNQQELYLWPVYDQYLWLGGLDKVDDPGDPCYFEPPRAAGHCPHTPRCSLPPAPPKAADPPRYYELTYFLVCGDCARAHHLPEWLRLVPASTWESRTKLLRRDIRAQERATWGYCLTLLCARRWPHLLSALTTSLYRPASQVQQAAGKKAVPAPAPLVPRKVLPFPAKELVRKSGEAGGMLLHLLGGSPPAFHGLGAARP